MTWLTIWTFQRVTKISRSRTGFPTYSLSARWRRDGDWIELSMSIRHHLGNRIISALTLRVHAAHFASFFLASLLACLVHCLDLQRDHVGEPDRQEKHSMWCRLVWFFSCKDERWLSNSRSWWNVNFLVPQSDLWLLENRRVVLARHSLDSSKAQSSTLWSLWYGVAGLVGWLDINEHSSRWSPLINWHVSNLRRTLYFNRLLPSHSV